MASFSRILPLLAVATILVWSAHARANPTGPQVTHGHAAFSTPNAGALHITTQGDTIINWRGFSIGAGELTRFVQNSATSRVLNRVTSSLPSTILGQLASNGRVFLINPMGS